jgi:hypothetical protein
MSMRFKLIYAFGNLGKLFCVVEYDALPAESVVNTFAIIVLVSSLADLVDRTVHHMASNMHCCTAGNKATE